MPDRRDEDRGYVARRIAGALNNAVRRVLFGQEKIEYGDGRIKWRRVPVYQLPPEDVPPPPVEPPSPPDPTPLPSPSGVFGRILHDYEVYGMSRPQWLELHETDPKRLELLAKANGFPETVPALDWRMIPMPPRWQWFWHDLIAKANPGYTASVWIGLFRKITRGNAFKTNKAGAEQGYYNAVTGENPGADPIKTGVLLTGGAWVQIVGETSNAYKVKALDIDKAPPSLDDFDGIHQTPTIFFATTSNRANNGSLVIPLTGGPNIPCPSVTKGKDYILIDKRRVKLLEGNTPPWPYNP